MKYFNVDKLKELIDEKWKELADKNVKIGGGKWDAEISTYLSVLSLIASLQQEQPEVDLERETVLNYAHEHYYYDKDFDGYGHGKFRPVFTRDDLIGFARHFYELGRNARKEDK